VAGREAPQPRPLGQLPGGEFYFAPIGEMRSDGERVQCHLCGGWYGMVGGSHLLNAHGWTTAEYRDAFLLNVTASTVGPVTSERKRKTMRAQIASGSRGYPLPKGPRPTPAAWRSFAAARPELVNEWHPRRNRQLEALGVNPRTVGARSDREVWWRCRVCGHEWQSRVDRRRDSGCPACRARKLRDRSVALLHPHLLTEWHAELNGNLDPYLVPASSERRAWWCCQTCGHEWASVIRKRTLRAQGCPECSSRQSAEFWRRERRWRRPREESLGVLHPELLTEWHPVRNEGLDPFAVGIGSNLRAWWRCRECGFEWHPWPANRCKGSGCPCCAARHTPRERSLASIIGEGFVHRSR
jgi:rubrerythrin